MLDNYATPAELIADAKILKAAYPRVLVEASGGINATTLAGFCDAAVDVVSVGGLTQGYAVADFSLKLAKGEGLRGISAVLGKLSLRDTAEKSGIVEI